MSTTPIITNKEVSLQFAKDKHQGQFRKFSGLPYVNHCINVSNTVLSCVGDHENGDILVSAALLHDTLEDTDTTYDELRERFGICVAELVLSLTNNKEDIQKVGKTAYMVSKIRYLSDDALLIKLADRLDNIQDLSNDDNVKQWSEQYAKQTKEILESILQPPQRPLTSNHLHLIELINTRLNVFFNKLQ